MVVLENKIVIKEKQNSNITRQLGNALSKIKDLSDQINKVSSKDNLETLVNELKLLNEQK